MKVIVLVKATAQSEAGARPGEPLLAAMGRYNQALAKGGILLAGEGLRPSSTGVRIGFSGDARRVVDGPFAQTGELVAGFWLWQVRSMQEAIEWGKRCPNPHEGPCEIEIRQIFEAEDFGDEFTTGLRDKEQELRERIALQPGLQAADASN